jgi:hypothetical protein
MIRPRPTTALVAAATVAATLVAACSGGGGSGPAPALSPVASCHPGTSGAENWIMGSGELTDAQSASPSSVSYAVSRNHLLVLLLRGQSSSAGLEVDDFRSYAEFKKMIDNGQIPASVHWVMYDNEHWALTPANEQADPVRYERLFAKLAHRNGYLVILAPAQDLVPGFSSSSFQGGTSAWQSYLSIGLATASARYGDIYEIQAQPYEIGVYRSENAYKSFVAAAAAQARAANPQIVIYAGLSTQRVTGAPELVQDYMATRDMVDGYWMNIPQHDHPGPVAVADQFFRDLPAAAASRSAACGGI